MKLISFLRKYSDKLLKIRNFLRSPNKKGGVFTTDSVLSDSQVTFYATKISTILKKEKSLKKFRRFYDYREILEHVDFKLGRKYLELLKEELPLEFQNLIESNKANDKFGKPYTYVYPRIGRISPTTLRYIYTSFEIGKTVGISSKDKICEIGIGYGGQGAVLSRMFGIKSIDVYDLPEVVVLAKRYLNEIGSRLKLSLGDLANSREYDLVISNFAFSELPKLQQEIYLKNILGKAKRGYLLMNSGRTDFTGRSQGKLSLENVIKFLPKAKVKEETPNSGRDNYVLYWG